jgi:hypothetical protein
MKYIKNLKIDQFKILEDISKNKIEVDYLIFNNFNQKEFEKEYKTIDEIKKMFYFFDNITTVKNIQSIKKDIFYNLAIGIADIVIKQNSYDEFTRKIILNNEYATLKVCRHFQKPIEGSEELFFNEDVLNYTKLSLTDQEKILKSNLDFYNYIYYILIPYYKKLHPNDYKKILINKYEDYFFRDHSMNRSDKLQVLEMFIKCIIELYDNIISKKIASKIFYIVDFTGRTRSVETIEHYINSIIFPHIRKTENKDQLDDIFYNVNGKYHYLYELILDTKFPWLSLNLIKFIRKKGTTELEKIILGNPETAREYSKMNYISFGDPELDKNIKSPNQGLKYIKSLNSGRPTNKKLEDYVLSGTPENNLSYFKNILKSNWTGNEDIKSRIEDKIAQSVFVSSGYINELVSKIPKKQKNPQFIKNYLDNNYARFRDIILNSNIFYLITTYDRLTN